MQQPKAVHGYVAVSIKTLPFTTTAIFKMALQIKMTHLKPERTHIHAAVTALMRWFHVFKAVYLSCICWYTLIGIH